MFMLSDEFKEDMKKSRDTALKDLLSGANLPSEYKERIFNNPDEIRKAFKIRREESPKC